MSGNSWEGPLEPLGGGKWLIPADYRAGMRVPGVIYADERLIESIREDRAPEQVANVACLPGIVGASLAMPDIHWGYGFPIGGVAAMDVETGVIAPGGIGYDINCGVRLLRSNLSLEQVIPRLDDIVSGVFSAIPTGVGSEGKIRTDRAAMAGVLEKGAAWAVERGYGWKEDLECCEEGGRLAGASPEAVSQKAFKRGGPQLGTLGSGNHFVEVSAVEEVYDGEAAAAFGLERDQVVFQIHSGSRGFGHQVCTDYLDVMTGAMRRHGINVPDRQLACAPVESEEGRSYFAAMASAANYAWANRQVLGYLVRESLSRVFRAPAESLGLDLVYDVAHNIAKFEEHEVNGSRIRVCVHRKGATRAFPPGHPGVPEKYRPVGQPVLVPGDMGRNSYVLAGTEEAMRQTFGSTCHGAGRLLSRAAAKREFHGSELRARLREQGIIVRAPSDGSIAEEAPGVYKDVNIVADAVELAGISRKVARLRPLGVVKG
ncbi:MAG: RtcB family protein [Ignavibacteriales bacterium]